MAVAATEEGGQLQEFGITMGVLDKPLDQLPRRDLDVPRTGRVALTLALPPARTRDAIAASPTQCLADEPVCHAPGGHIRVVTDEPPAGRTR
jgi:hypothetical protein